MNVIFLTLLDIKSLEEKTIYTDLLRVFYEKGHRLCLVSPTERRNGEKSYTIKEEKGTILKVRTGNIFRAGLIEKGISTLLLEGQYKRAIHKFFPGAAFDLILYSTPPINFEKVIRSLKKAGGRSYLLLKDIFPQNAVDLGMFSKSGLLYRFFRRKERRLYRISDRIGCMSLANRDYILEHNREIRPESVEVCPNTITPLPREAVRQLKSSRAGTREEYGMPQEAVIYIYGGNLGKPQGVDFLISCLKENKKREDVYFLICGNGTEYDRIEIEIKQNEIGNVKLIRRLEKPDYDRLVAACDVGLIFLDRRFTIPNFPSRLLSYLEYELPVLACTDRTTDLGRILEEAGAGYWCESRETGEFTKLLMKLREPGVREDMGRNGRSYLEENYSSEQAYRIIMKQA